MIKRCTCEHKNQDRMYGKKLRVMNRCNGKVGEVYRCTVCGKESN